MGRADLTSAIDAVAYGRHGSTLLADSATTEVQGSLKATLPAPNKGLPICLARLTAHGWK